MTQDDAQIIIQVGSFLLLIALLIPAKSWKRAHLFIRNQLIDWDETAKARARLRSPASVIGNFDLHTIDWTTPINPQISPKFRPELLNGSFDVPEGTPIGPLIFPEIRTDYFHKLKPKKEKTMKIDLAAFRIQGVRINGIHVPAEYIEIKLSGETLEVSVTDDQIFQEMSAAGLAPLPDSPPQREAFFLVWQPDTGYTRYRHPDADAALTEAARMARTHPGKEFMVLAPIKTVKLFETTEGFDFSIKQRVQLDEMEADIPF